MSCAKHTVDNKIKVILFDVDNTLLDFNKCAELSMKKTFEYFDMNFDTTILPLFTEVNNHLWGEIEKGRLTKDGLYEIRWDMVFEHIHEVQGVNPAIVGGNVVKGIDFENIFLSHLATASETVDGANELLEYLSEKYMLCIASNAPYKQQTSRLQGANLLHFFDKLFISEQIGYAKPAVKFFDACFAQLPGILPCEVAIIGDSLRADIRGGIEYGLTTCWFDPYLEGTTGKALDCSVKTTASSNELFQIASHANYVVHSLSEIIDIF